MQMRGDRVANRFDSRADARRPTAPLSWLNSERTGAARKADRRDALLGACLVVSLPLVVISTLWLLPFSGKAVDRSVAIELAASLLAFTLLCLPWPRLPAPALLVFPGILAVVLISTAHF